MTKTKCDSPKGNPPQRSCDGISRQDSPPFNQGEDSQNPGRKQYSSESAMSRKDSGMSVYRRQAKVNTGDAPGRGHTFSAFRMQNVNEIC